MSKDNIVSLLMPGGIEDSLTELLRNGARRLIQQAIEAELAEMLAKYEGQTDEQGRRAVVRNGYLPEREILTGVGPVTSTGQMKEALEVLVGPEAKGLSASVIGRLKREWEAEYTEWCQRDMRGVRWVYWWADAIYSGLRAEGQKLCALVIIGVNERGEKHFLAIEDGIRESTQSWREVLLGLKQRGLDVPPKLAVGDGALGFWAALEEVYPETRHQRCWVHKTANVLNYLPKAVQPKAKKALQEIWMAEDRASAHKAFDHFVATYQAKYPKAVTCLEKDREALLAFYDFPAEHWVHIRTTNPIESAFATIRHRSDQAKGCVSRNTLLAMLYKLGMSAQKRWRRIRGFNYLAKVVEGVKFRDGVEVNDKRETDESRNAA
ncbi:IS256 family transposase [Hydrogenophilus thermoluteolus]|uniref:IS256 family transposase n=1 Tax=Hydrogenophilus thermoluteolus TaxID=297 RepID=UPI0024A3B75C|nr:IS256 family transposase [Hydrogenophilus thermoluteolus]GLW60414.1 IS256 family transposase [Hydrogenophilus thermoluteolus]